MEIYVVTMYRYGNHESHSYVLGVFDDPELAIRAGAIEEVYRGSKYDAEVKQFTLNESDQL